MKHIIKFIIAAAIALSAFTATAQQIPVTSFGLGGYQNTNSTNQVYCVIPGNKGLGRACIEWISATSDAVAAPAASGGAGTGAFTQGFLTIAPCISNTFVNISGVGATNQIYVQNATNFVSNSIAVFYDSGSDTYQMLTVTTNNGTNVIFTGNTVQTPSVGDSLYLAQPQTAIPVVAFGGTVNTINLGGAGGVMFSRRQGEPILVAVNGKGTNVINLMVGGTFRP